jgi:hypothetical protein
MARGCWCGAALIEEPGDAFLEGVDASDAGIATLFERVRDIPFAFAPHTDAVTAAGSTSTPRSIVR